MSKHTVNSLAEALYEGEPTLGNLAENMARQYGKASALSFFNLMSKNVQFFWKDIAKQIIRHSKEWENNEGGCCVLSKKEHVYLEALKAIREAKISEKYK